MVATRLLIGAPRQRSPLRRGTPTALALMRPLLPPDEPERLATLHALALLDTPAERAFDDLTRLAADLCGTPMAAVSLLDADRQWFKSAVGLGVSQTPREIAFCAHAIHEGELLVVPDARSDRRFAANPLVTADPHLRFYAGAPLRSRGRFALGTLCVLDRIPRRLSPGQLRALRAVADQVEALLDLRAALRDVAEAEAALRRDRDALARTLAQRDRLAAFLVHDFGNLLSAVLANADYLLASPDLDPSASDEVLRDIVSAAARLQVMSRDLLDIQLAEGGGLPVLRAPVDVATLVREVARVASPPGVARVECRVEPDGLSASADRELVRRVLSNLLDNARKYGGPHLSITATGAASGGLELRVIDDGTAMPVADHDRVFDAYVRLEDGAAKRWAGGRGLGLAFCRAAVEAHGGRIWVEEAEPRGTAFCLSLPAR